MKCKYGFIDQVHISLVGKDHMRVSWITEARHVSTTVEYGKEAGKYNEIVKGEHTWYQYFLYNSGKIHHVTIGPLEPSTVYYYRCGGFGPEFSFRTPPSAFPIDFVVVGMFNLLSLFFFHLRKLRPDNLQMFLTKGKIIPDLMIQKSKFHAL